MSSRTTRLTVLLVGASLGSVGWGAVLPFLYADIADARGLGAASAAITFTAFAIGSLVAAPWAGRLADRSRPAVVATVARLAMVATIVAIMLAQGLPVLALAAIGYGASLAIVQPAVSVMVLELAPVAKRRDVFAWQFIGLNLGLALGGVVGGHVVDLTHATGARPAYAFAALCSLASALLVGRAGRGTAPAAADVRIEDSVGYRTVLRAPGVRWMLAVTVLLTLACYAQYDSGLPAYALSVLDVDPATLGTAVAVNAVLVGVLTAPVVRMTRHVSPARLLALCGLMWIGVWVVLGIPMLSGGLAGSLVIGGYALFSIGETMLAPVLTPLAAALAPEGAVGRTLAAVTGAQTLATAVGPGLSGALLALGAPSGFIVLQIAVCAIAVVGAKRLHGSIRHLRREELTLAG
ncbi:MFS transporter [Jatrophihabitans fulvus]